MAIFTPPEGTVSHTHILIFFGRWKLTTVLCRRTYKVTTFGEFQDVKRKGRTPIAAKSKTESPKKKVTYLKHEDEDEEESGNISQK